jgi:translation initiation factor 1 (eIF-1/SUI1)
MAKKKKRVDTSAGRDGLTSNPFAALGQQLSSDLPEGPSGASPPPEATEPTLPFSVARTRKGGWPVRIEKRASDKVVTVIENVSGNGEALLALLRKQCGAGGVVREDCVEVQGDHRAGVEMLLSKLR